MSSCSEFQPLVFSDYLYIYFFLGIHILLCYIIQYVCLRTYCAQYLNSTQRFYFYVLILCIEIHL